MYFYDEMNNLMNRMAPLRLSTHLKPTIHFKLVNDYEMSVAALGIRWLEVR